MKPTHKNRGGNLAYLPGGNASNLQAAIADAVNAFNAQEEPMRLDYIDEDVKIPYMPDFDELHGMRMKHVSPEQAASYRYSFALNSLIETAQDLMNIKGLSTLNGYGEDPVLSDAVLSALKTAAFACMRETT